MGLFTDPPRFSRDQVIALLKALYNMEAGVESLPAERDQNYMVTDENGARYVLKIANAGEDPAILRLQNKVLRHLEDKVSFCPCVIPDGNGAFLSEVKAPSGDQHHAVRLLTYIPGKTMGDTPYHSDALLVDLGRSLGRMDQALLDLREPTAERDFPWDLANGLKVVRRYQDLVQDPVLKRTVIDWADHFEKHVAPLLHGLPKSIIHNDANDYNVLVAGDGVAADQHVTGIIDYGDVANTYTVAEPAIALAYALLGKEDPMGAARLLVKGYHQERPLRENELAALFGLMRLRLCVSVCMAAWQNKQRPDEEYLYISQASIREALPLLDSIHPRLAEAQFRQVCGLEALRGAKKMVRQLQDSPVDGPSVIPFDLRKEAPLVLDLGVGSPLYKGSPKDHHTEDLNRRIQDRLSKAGVKVGVGRYNEARLLYTSDLFKGESSKDDRTVHLGMDLFVPAGTPVLAPLAGKVFSWADNKAPLDYGPVMILEHRGEEGRVFYTLYGHLSLDSLDGLMPGQAAAPGQVIARIGTPDVNGGYAPHLHFQIILDLLDMGCDFPGVARAGERAFWCALSPDPNLILNIPQTLFPESEPAKADTLETRLRRIGRNLSIGYREPVKAVRGWMQHLYDESGRCYLDAYNNVPHVGHCHPRVVEAACEQMALLNTNTRYLHDHINRYAEALCRTLPDPLSVCYFVNSASEANELALRMARAYTDQKDMIVLEAAYHGHTTSLIDISPYKHDGPGGKGPPDWVHKAPVADVYRGPHKADDPGAGMKYASHVQEICQRLGEQGKRPAGFIAESCPSVGGQIVFPAGYLAHVFRYVRQAGGLCIADEVQTGYGRTGTDFYAFQAQDVVPDIVILGKPIGNGHPIGALITTPQIAEAFDNGMEFFSTFGGNTVSCLVGWTVLQVALEENLQENALKAGRRMLEGMAPFPRRFPIVGDVRGSGLFLGIELVRDRQTLEPAAREASFIINRMREEGILLGTDGPFHNVIKIRPPMPFNETDADRLVSTLERILTQSFGD